jgi:hypothetical protein
MNQTMHLSSFILQPSSFRAAVAALLAGLAGLGCSSGDPLLAVQGKVTFQGRPVAEGTVQFNDAKTGRGAEVEIGPGGAYQAQLPAGDYAVVVLPPLRVVRSKGGPPDPQFKKVPDVPDKYRSTATSRLTAEVRAGQTTHDFDLNP